MWLGLGKSHGVFLKKRCGVGGKGGGGQGGVWAFFRGVVWGGAGMCESSRDSGGSWSGAV